MRGFPVFSGTYFWISSFIAAIRVLTDKEENSVMKLCNIFGHLLRDRERIKGYGQSQKEATRRNSYAC
jgi:hypothetical protein